MTHKIGPKVAAFTAGLILLGVPAYVQEGIISKQIGCFSNDEQMVAAVQKILDASYAQRPPAPKVEHVAKRHVLEWFYRPAKGGRLVWRVSYDLHRCGWFLQKREYVVWDQYPVYQPANPK
jgi:hypothetical protein